MVSTSTTAAKCGLISLLLLLHAVVFGKPVYQNKPEINVKPKVKVKNINSFNGVLKIVRQAIPLGPKAFRKEDTNHNPYNRIEVVPSPKKLTETGAASSNKKTKEEKDCLECGRLDKDHNRAVSDSSDEQGETLAEDREICKKCKQSGKQNGANIGKLSKDIEPVKKKGNNYNVISTETENNKVKGEEQTDDLNEENKTGTVDNTTEDDRRAETEEHYDKKEQKPFDKANNVDVGKASKVNGNRLSDGETKFPNDASRQTESPSDGTPTESTPLSTDTSKHESSEPIDTTVDILMVTSNSNYESATQEHSSLGITTPPSSKTPMAHAPTSSSDFPSSDDFPTVSILTKVSDSQISTLNVLSPISPTFESLSEPLSSTVASTLPNSTIPISSTKSSLSDTHSPISTMSFSNSKSSHSSSLFSSKSSSLSSILFSPSSYIYSSLSPYISSESSPIPPTTSSSSSTLSSSSSRLSSSMSAPFSSSSDVLSSSSALLTSSLFPLTSSSMALTSSPSSLSSVKSSLSWKTSTLSLPLSSTSTPSSSTSYWSSPVSTKLSSSSSTSRLSFLLSSKPSSSYLATSSSSFKPSSSTIALSSYSIVSSSASPGPRYSEEIVVNAKDRHNIRDMDDVAKGDEAKFNSNKVGAQEGDAAKSNYNKVGAQKGDEAKGGTAKINSHTVGAQEVGPAKDKDRAVKGGVVKINSNKGNTVSAQEVVTAKDNETDNNQQSEEATIKPTQTTGQQLATKKLQALLENMEYNLTEIVGNQLNMLFGEYLNIDK